MVRKNANSLTASNRKQLATAQSQFKKLESRLATLDKEYVAIQAATGQLVAGLLGMKTPAGARASGRVSNIRSRQKEPAAARGTAVLDRSDWCHTFTPAFTCGLKGLLLNDTPRP